MIRPSAMTYGFGFSAQYDKSYQQISLDLCYKKLEWQFYLSYSQNWNPMAAAMGANKNDLKAVRFNL